jgi:uncharacterized protein (DUF3084 family)
MLMKPAPAVESDPEISTGHDGALRLREEIDELKERLTALAFLYDQVCREKDSQIAARNDQIAAKTEQIAVKDRQIAAKDDQIATKDDQIATKDAQIAWLLRRLDRWRRRRHRLLWPYRLIADRITGRR